MKEQFLIPFLKKIDAVYCEVIAIKHRSNTDIARYFAIDIKIVEIANWRIIEVFKQYRS